MNKRQARQQAHAIVANIIWTAIIEGAPPSIGCDERCGDCPACHDDERVREEMQKIYDRHQRFGVDYRNHRGPSVRLIGRDETTTTARFRSIDRME